MEKKYTINEFEDMFINAQREILEETLSDKLTEIIKKQKPNDNEDTIREFQTSQMISAMLYTSKLYNKLFKKEGK